MPDTTSASTKAQRKRDSQRRYYEANVEKERRAARIRAERRRSRETSVERARRLELHREAQARYRSANKRQLNIKSWQYRKNKKYQAAKDRDEEEFRAVMGSDMVTEQ